MNIYAATANTLRSYLGKNVWVKCLNRNSSEPCYVNVVSEGNSKDHLLGNVFYEHVLRYTDPKEIRSELSARDLPIVPEDYKIVTPEVILRAEDIYDVPKYLGELNKYVGKDVWVKVFSYLYNYECYINIISIDGATIKYHPVDAGMIDYHSPSDWDCDEFPTEDDLDYVETTTLDSLELITPVEVLTTEEIIEELNKCVLGDI